MKNFKKMYNFDSRHAEALRIKGKYPNSIPIIVEKAKNSSIKDLNKRKYLVPNNFTVGQFIYIIRKRIKLSPEQAIFVFVNNSLLPTSALMSQVYKENKEKDEFMYISYQGESTFG